MAAQVEPVNRGPCDPVHNEIIESQRRILTISELEFTARRELDHFPNSGNNCDSAVSRDPRRRCERGPMRHLDCRFSVSSQSEAWSATAYQRAAAYCN